MPDLKEVHVDAALTNVSIEFGVGTFMAERLAPSIDVLKQSDKYFIIDVLREVLRQQATNRAPGTKAEVVDRRVTTDTYSADDHALSKALPDEIVQNADNAIAQEISSVEFLSRMLGVDREIVLKVILDAGLTNTAAASAASDATGGWDQDTSDPIADVKSATKSIRDALGVQPNVIGMDIDVFEALQDHPLIVDRIKYTSSPNQPAIVNTTTLAQLFNVAEIAVASIKKNTAAKGAAASLSAVWSDTVYIEFVERLGIESNSAAQTFAWNGMPGAVGGRKVSRWRDDDRGAEMFRLNHYYDQKVVTAGAGYRITNVLQAS